jgi:hypothetical protein
MGKLLVEAVQNREVGALLYRKFIEQGRLLFSEFLNIRKQTGELTRQGHQCCAAGWDVVIYLLGRFRNCASCCADVIRMCSLSA